jgi:hypothetical protein
MTGQIKLHPRSTFKQPQRVVNGKTTGLGVVIRTISHPNGTYSGWVDAGGSCQPRIARSNRSNREAAIKSVLRAIDSTWCDHEAQDALDRKRIAKLESVDLAQCHFETSMRQLVNEVVDRYSDLDMREAQESIDYSWACDASWANDCTLNEGNDDCSCDQCEDVNGFRAARLSFMPSCEPRTDPDYDMQGFGFGHPAYDT